MISVYQYIPGELHLKAARRKAQSGEISLSRIELKQQYHLSRPKTIKLTDWYNGEMINGNRKGTMHRNPTLHLPQ